MALIFTGIKKDPEYMLWHHEKICDFKTFHDVYVGLQILWADIDFHRECPIYRVYVFDPNGIEEFQIQEEYYCSYREAKQSFKYEVLVILEDL